MANYKTPPDRNFVRENRPHDFIYDATYTIPSKEDFYRHAEVGTDTGAKMTIRPVYKSMFSDIKGDKRITGCLKLSQPNNLDNFAPQHNLDGWPVMPAETCLYRNALDPTGADRAIHAIRYNDNPKFVLEKPRFDYNQLDRDEQKRLLAKTRKSGVVNRGMQTDFRESEAQTDPYTPPYTLPYPGSFPKVLALSKLTWGKGLPVNLEDIVVIERALTRRMLEYVEKDKQDVEEDFEKRIKVMEELEAQQWIDREKELDKLLEKKLEITKQLLADYEIKIANDHTVRLERLQDYLRSENVEFLKLIKHKYFRDLRKLERKYYGPNKVYKRDVIDEHLKFDSHLYAPLTRNGPNPDMLAKVPKYTLDLHRNFEELKEVTENRCFIKKELQFDMKRFKSKLKKTKPGATVLAFERKLDDVFETFSSKKKRPTNLFQQLQMQKQKPQLMKPKSANTQLTTQSDVTEVDRRMPYLVMLQKQARGKAIQDFMRKEIEGNIKQVKSLQRMFEMDPNCKRVDEGLWQKLTAMRKAEQQKEKEGAEVNEVVDHLEGESLTRMLDFLDKEMIRLLDERKIHSLILLAERDRRKKEALEGGRRYHEEEKRRFNDEVFRNIVGINQDTVDMYLEDMYLDSCNRVADDEARHYVRNLATTLNQAAFEDLTIHKDLSEESVAEIVSGFIIPELSRLYHKEHLDNAESRHVIAARQVTDAMFSAHQTLTDIIEETGSKRAGHMEKGVESFEGSVVNDAIKDAVYDALRKSSSSEQQERHSHHRSESTVVELHKRNTEEKKESIAFSEVEDLSAQDPNAVTEPENEPVDETEKIDPIVTTAFEGAGAAVDAMFKSTKETVLPLDSNPDLSAESADDDEDD